MDRFFCVSDPVSKREFRARLAIPEDMLLAALNGRATSVNSIPAVHGMGSGKPSDIVWTTSAYPLLVSSRVIELLRSNGLTGWGAIPCSLRGKDQSLIVGFFYLTIRGRCGPIDRDRSVVFKKEYPGGIFDAWRGLFFDTSSWDGSDIFMPNDSSAWIFCSERFKEVFERAKVKNIEFTDVELVERSFR